MKTVLHGYPILIAAGCPEGTGKPVDRSPAKWDDSGYSTFPPIQSHTAPESISLRMISYIAGANMISLSMSSNDPDTHPRQPVTVDAGESALSPESGDRNDRLRGLCGQRVDGD